jgi:hypothetical protein
MKRERQLFRQLRHKPRVVFGVCAANPMLQMRDFQVQAKFISQLAKNVKQGHRIRPAGDGNQDAVANR